jgi:hypothetical protein
VENAFIPNKYDKCTSQDDVYNAAAAIGSAAENDGDAAADNDDDYNDGEEDAAPADDDDNDGCAVWDCGDTGGDAMNLPSGALGWNLKKEIVAAPFEARLHCIATQLEFYSDIEFVPPHIREMIDAM